MIRASTALFAAAVVVVGYAMFQVKYEVMQQEETLARINHEIVDGREKIRVLNAEWSFLTQPSRLDELRRRYLNLVPIGTAQLGNLDAIPLRQPGAALAPALPEAVAPPPHPASHPGAQLAAYKPSVER